MIAQKPVFAEQTSFSDLYIAIGDAIMSTKAGEDAEATEALQQFEETWKTMTPTDKEAAQSVSEKLQAALAASNEEQKLAALTDLSKALHAFEKKENPVDEAAERAAFKKAIQPALTELETAISTNDKQTIEEATKKFLAAWTKNERPVREQDIAAYGKIETQMSFMRIALAADETDFEQISGQYDALKAAIDDFAAGKQASKTAGTYTVATLIGQLEQSKEAIQQKQYDEAAEILREFIVTWPNVEGEIRTKNATLYQKIENDLPFIISDLSNKPVKAEAATKKIDTLYTELSLLTEDTSYHFWDSALIMLREGVEALLVIIGLLAFLKRANQEQGKRWIYGGAIAGILVSILAAIIMSTLFQSVTIGTSREKMESYTGLAAAILMIGVGVWLHSKSTVLSWNQYISKRLNHAISKQSVWAMGAISFLSIAREGAETIVFYAGIAPKMPTSEFIAGILVALAILAILTVVLLRITGRIPVHRFFAVATVLIYLLAFKIIGVSLHMLQVTDVLPTHIVPGLPIINLIGFYPTQETLIGQSILLLVIAGTMVYKRKQELSTN
nr:FTR1 family protein [Sporosarcina cyprini]